MAMMRKAQRFPAKPKPHLDDWDHEPHKNTKFFVPISNVGDSVYSFFALLAWRTKFGVPAVSKESIISHSERDPSQSFLKSTKLKTPTRDARESFIPSDNTCTQRHCESTKHISDFDATKQHRKDHLIFVGDLPPHWPALMDLSIDTQDLCIDFQTAPQKMFDWTDLCRDDLYAISDETAESFADEVVANSNALDRFPAHAPSARLPYDKY
jgi:hypothetical protein